MYFKNKKQKFDEYIVKLEECLAKTETIDGKTVSGVSVKDHCLLTGFIAKHIFESYFQSIDALNCITDYDLIASLHDIGKISQPFQNMIYSSLSDKDIIPNFVSKDISNLSSFRHEAIGQAFISEFGEEQKNDCWKAISRIIGGHHGFFTTNERFYSTDAVIGGEPYNNARKELLEDLIKEFNGKIPNLKENEEILFLTGLTIVSDWISSALKKEELPHNPSDYSSFAKNKVEEAGFKPLEIIRGLSFGEVFGFSPYKVQEDFFNSVDAPGTYILEVDMGKGKTEAALYAAYRLLEKKKATGIYFALPTKLTSLAIYERMLSFLEKITSGNSPAKLVFQNAYLYLNSFAESSSPGGDWFDGRKRGILAPFGVGTIDQALMSVINVKHSSLRAFGLSGKVVIIDELHSYDEYTGSLISILVHLIRKLGGTVIILSATLRLEAKKSVLGLNSSNKCYPLITYSYNGNDLHEKSTQKSNDKCIKIVHANLKTGIDTVLQTALNGGKVLWITNTVDEAQKIYSIFISRCENTTVNVGLLHSHFLQNDRKRIEDEFIPFFGKKPKRSEGGVILVGTQVLEQSLDIDADLMVTEIAPMDMLLQRIGRLWRHPTNDNKRPCIHPKCIILHPSMEDAEKNVMNIFGVNGVVYAPYVLYRTLKNIYNIEEITVPSDIRSLIEKTYCEEPLSNPSVKRAYEDLVNQRNEMSIQAMRVLNFAQTTATDDEFSTRYQSQKTSTLLLLKKYDPLTKTIELVDGKTLVLDKSASKSKKIEIASCLLQFTMTLSTKIIPDEAFLLDSTSILNSFFYLGDKEKKEAGVLLVSQTGELLDFFGNTISKRDSFYMKNIGYTKIKEDRK